MLEQGDDKIDAEAEVEKNISVRNSCQDKLANWQKWNHSYISYLYI